MGRFRDRQAEVVVATVTAVTQLSFGGRNARAGADTRPGDLSALYRAPGAARSEGTASALLTATHQTGSGFGVAIVSAVLVVLPGSFVHRSSLAFLTAASFAFVGLLLTRVVSPGPPRPESPRLEHLVHRLAGGLP